MAKVVGIGEKAGGAIYVSVTDDVTGISASIIYYEGQETKGNAVQRLRANFEAAEAKGVVLSEQKTALQAVVDTW